MGRTPLARTAEPTPFRAIPSSFRGFRGTVGARPSARETLSFIGKPTKARPSTLLLLATIERACLWSAADSLRHQLLSVLRCAELSFRFGESYTSRLVSRGSRRLSRLDA